MTTITLTRPELKRHLFVWGIITGYIVLFDPVSSDNIFVQLTGTIILMGNYILPYYIFSLVLMPTFWKNRIPLLILTTLVLYVIFFSISYSYFFYYLPAFGGANRYADHPFFEMLSYESILFMLVIVASSSFFLKRLSIDQLKKQNEKEKVMITKELNFLKDQFNSHITFNFLNYCYSHIHQHSEDAADAIEIFSNMLRYTLSISPEEKIPLAREVTYIKNFIELQKLLSSKAMVEMEIEGNTLNHHILPRILINFVENAFKHGLFNNPKKPIKIKLTITDEQLVFKVENHKSEQKKIIKTGIGQNNTKQVLDLYYPEKYNLDIMQDNTKYSCTLILKF